MSKDLTFGNILLPNGVRLHYAEQGPANGPVVLMLHGYSDSWFSFSRVLPMMKASQRIIVPSLRGHGDSDRPEKGYLVADFTTDVLHLMDALRVSEAFLIGHSMGSFVAQRIAATAPDRISGLVLVGSAATIRNKGVLEFARDLNSLKAPIDPNFVRNFQSNSIFRPVPDDFFDAVVAESLKLPLRTWQMVLASLLADDSRSDLGAIRCPVKILWGDEDVFFSREDQEELLQGLPQAEFTILSEMGHTPQWEDPGGFVGLITVQLESQPVTL